MNARHLKDGFYPLNVVPSSIEGGTRQSAKWPIARFSVLFHSGGTNRNWGLNK